MVTHVVVRNPAGAVVGGARVHRACRSRPLPALRALREAPALRAVLAAGAHETLVELASLWVERDAGLRGLGRLIGQASIATAAVNGAHRAVTFSHLTIAAMLQAIGMRPTPSAEPIDYPNASYRSTVWEVDPRNPEHAAAPDRRQIASLREWWTENPSAPIAIESTPAAALPWSVVGPQHATPLEREQHNANATRPRFSRVPLHPQASGDGRRDR